MTVRDVFDQLQEGDHILYNAKKLPLTVAEVGENKVLVDGPKGGEYTIYPAPDDTDVLLVSERGNREYASKVEDLRIVGRWERTGERQWEHTKTGATVAVTENELGYWTVEIDGFDGDLPDTPKYGFTEREQAIETAEKFIRNHPEG